jgi:hypothetical protein
VESSCEFGFGFHKMLGNYGVATQLVASRVAPSSMELISFSYKCMRESRNVYRISIRKSEDKRQLGKSVSRTEANCKMNVREMVLILYARLILSTLGRSGCMWLATK